VKSWVGFWHYFGSEGSEIFNSKLGSSDKPIGGAVKYEKRTNKNGTSYFSFVWYDKQNDKRTRLTKREIRERFGHDILTEKEAKECLKLLEAQYETEKIKIKRRLQWEEHYYNFTSLLEQYNKVQKKRAPNSWKNNEHYLKYYVLPFFLGEKKLNNIDLWEDYFSEFRDWLEDKATLIRSDKPLAYSSKNHCVKALNTFLAHLYRQKIIARDVKCEWFGDHLVKKRNIDDVLSEEQVDLIYEQLKEDQEPLVATFFRYLFFSGMRFSEGLAISLQDIFQGELPDTQILAKKLKFHDIQYYGYIISDSQVDDNWNRKPFKGRKSIEEKYSRTIPVVDRQLWNDLVDLSQKKYQEFKKSDKSKKECFLFEGLDDTTATRKLQLAFKSVKIKYKSWHCLRHSRATWLVGETGDEPLARAWLGHSSAKVFERYNHIYQSLIREAKSKELVGDDFKLKKV
jgi:integrase